MKDFAKGLDGLWRYQSRVFIQASDDLRKKIMEEAQKSNFTIHLSITKMYHDLEKIFCWLKMKMDIVEVASRCLVCQKVKIKHQKPSGVLQPWRFPNGKGKIFP